MPFYFGNRVVIYHVCFWLTVRSCFSFFVFVCLLAIRQKNPRGKKKAQKKTLPQALDGDALREGPVPDGWRTPEIKTLEVKFSNAAVVTLFSLRADAKFKFSQKGKKKQWQRKRARADPIRGFFCLFCVLLVIHRSWISLEFIEGCYDRRNALPPTHTS